MSGYTVYTYQNILTSFIFAINLQNFSTQGLQMGWKE